MSGCRGAPDARGPRPCPAMRRARCAAFLRLYTSLRGTRARAAAPSLPAVRQARFCLIL